MIPSLTKHQLNLTILWYAQLYTVGMYWIVWFLIGRTLPRPAEAPGALLVGIAVATCAAFAAAFVILRTVAGQVEGAVQRLIQGRPEGLNIPLLIGRVQAAGIIAMLCLEAPAVLALVAVFSGWPDFATFAGLTGLSIAGLLLFRQRALPTLFAVLARLDQSSTPCAASAPS